MNVKLNKGVTCGNILVPPSKSISQRICAAALLRDGETIVYNYGSSNDEIAALNIIQELGAVVSFSGNKLTINATGIIKPVTQINCAESGLAARLFTPIAALSDVAITINGSGSLLTRSMAFLKPTLESLDVILIDFSGSIPFIVKGPLQAKDIVVDGSMSSQFISGLLFAFARSATHKVKISVVDLVSKPYIDLTLQVLKIFGYHITHSNHQLFFIDPALFCRPRKIELKVESDWSSAAFWIAAATINGTAILQGLEKNSAQADKVLLDIVKQIGAIVTWKNSELTIESKSLKPFTADLTDAPDLFPVLSILAACCNGKSTIKGLHRLPQKESNRTESICTLLSLLQVGFEIIEDEILIVGQNSFPSVKYDCPNDHRMAMACALASLHCAEHLEIENAECVNKSYPNFWTDFRAAIK